METSQFWETRAQRYATRGAGLKAVCSYAMPEFYNRAIDLTQRAALAGVLASIRPGDRVLDYGCGVGRWTREMARRGATVTAVDFSPTMITEAIRRTNAAGLGERCRFIHSDVTTLALSERFDVVFGVTVLQHVLGEAQLTQTIARLAGHLRPGGRLISVEAAPSRSDQRCDTATFHARPLATYTSNIESAGLAIRSVRGIDPAPFKLWVLPRFRHLPKPLALAALALATGLSLPYDVLLARLLTGNSWHKLIMAETAGDPP